jgi:hypothetical protein
VKKKVHPIIFFAFIAGIGLWGLHDVRQMFTQQEQYVQGLEKFEGLNPQPDQPASPTSNGLPDQVAAKKMLAAMDNYLRDHNSRGQPLPASMTVQDLVSSGYLSTNDVQALGGMDATFYPTANYHDPKAVLARWLMPDGTQMTFFANGTVQKSPR